MTDFIKTYLPQKEEWISIKNRIIYENERVKILTKVGIDIDIRTGEISFSLPNFGLTNRETIIETLYGNGTRTNSPTVRKPGE